MQNPIVARNTYEMFNSEKTKNQEKQITRRMRPLNGNCFVGRASQVVIYRFYFLLFYLQNDLVLCDNPPSLYSFLLSFFLSLFLYFFISLFCFQSAYCEYCKHQLIGKHKMNA